MAIIAYQIIIAVIIIVSAFFGRGALGIIILAACLWTITHIFMPWLMILQFGTILISALIGLPIAFIMEWLYGTIQKIRDRNTKYEVFNKVDDKKDYKQKYYDCNDHNIVKGICTLCGCSETAIYNFGWKCNTPDTNHTNGKYLQRDYEYAGHSIVNGKCTKCGCTEKAIYGFGWKCKIIL